MSSGTHVGENRVDVLIARSPQTVRVIFHLSNPLINTLIMERY